MNEFDPCAIPLPVTGSSGGNALLLLLGVAAVVIAYSIYLSRSRKAGVPMALALVLAGAGALVMSWNSTPAFADQSVDPCMTTSVVPPTMAPTTTAPSVSPTQTAAPGVSPTPTVAPTVAPTPTPTVPPAPKGSISGVFSRIGNDVLITTMPDQIPGGNPKPPVLIEGGVYTHPHGLWSLPELTPASAANQTITLISAGPDGVFGGADDVIVATTKTDIAGAYTFTNLAPGQYRVEADQPASPDLSLIWQWPACRAWFKPTDPNVDQAEQGNIFTSPSRYDLTLATDQVVIEKDFRTTNSIGLAGECIEK